MTFLEAAIEVLRREGKPTDVKRLAELAVKLNLLSVVGRDPARTLGERPSGAVAAGGSRREPLRLRPGVSGLRQYPDRPYPTGGAAAATAGAATSVAAGAAPEGGGEGARRRRRRRGRGGGGGAEGPAPAEAGEPETAEAGEPETAQ